MERPLVAAGCGDQRAEPAGGRYHCPATGLYGGLQYHGGAGDFDPSAPALSPWAEKLTGIINQALEQALSPDEAVSQLEELDGPFLFLDRDFTLPFLQNAYLRCGREFALPCLLLDRPTAMLLGCSPRQRADAFLEQLPPPDGLGGMPPHNTDLRKLYELSLAVFRVLEETHHIQNTAQLNDFKDGENHDV